MGVLEMKRVYTDLNSPWSTVAAEEVLSPEQARAEHEKCGWKDQEGYIPVELATRLEAAWNVLQTISEEVDRFRTETGQGDGR
jgi:hypothetical protein